MQLNEYQRDAERTMTLDPDRVPHLLAVFGLGLAGEAGEVVDHLKKFIGHGHELDRLKIQRELGDVLWYVAAVASVLGLKLDDIAAVNVRKLRERYPAGFSHEASKARPPESSPTWPLVLAFAKRMEAKLDKNRHKGNREGWKNDDGEALVRRLEEEMQELKVEVAGVEAGGERRFAVADEAADVANFAMMLADNFGDLVKP